MTLDERIQFLVQSTESLHQTQVEAFERMDKEQAARVKHERAIMHAILAYLDNKQPENGDPR